MKDTAYRPKKQYPQVGFIASSVTWAAFPLLPI